MTRSFVLAALLIGMMEQPTPAADPRPLQVDDMFQFRRVADPQISPDGQHVVYSVTEVSLEDNSSQSHLWLATCDGSSPPRQLTRAEKKDSHPRWSPDGKWILFQSNRSGSSQLWAIQLSGGEAIQLTDVASEASTGIWSPDGRGLAFVSAVFPEYSTQPFAESNRLHRERTQQIADDPVKARVADRLFFRHWDSYVEDKRQHIFHATFDPATGEAGEPRDITPGDRDAVPTSMTFSASHDFCFSPDGTHVVFTAVPEENEAWNTNHDLCRVAVDNQSSDWPVLGSFSAAEGSPAFSADGQQFAFRAQSRPNYEADKWDVFVVECDAGGRWTSTPRCLTKQLDLSADDVFWRTDADHQPLLSFPCQRELRVVLVYRRARQRGRTSHAGRVGGLGPFRERQSRRTPPGVSGITL